jgi:hypothetical protein
MSYRHRKSHTESDGYDDAEGEDNYNSMDNEDNNESMKQQERNTFMSHYLNHDDSPSLNTDSKKYKQDDKERYQEDNNKEEDEEEEEGKNNSPQSNQDYNEVDDEDTEEPDLSETASFPTQEDLESIIVHPPESVPGDVEVRSVSSIEYGLLVSHNYSSVRSIGSTGSFKDRIGGSTGGISVGGGGSSVGGMSEKSETKSSTFLETDRKLSFTGSEDHAEGKMMIGAIPNGITYAASEMTVKSDAATICSGSVLEDIDMSSVGTVHSSGNLHTVVNGAADRQQAKRRQERGVEFASESSFTTMFTSGMMQGGSTGAGIAGSSSRNPQIPIHFRQIPAGSIAMNDMGPPLNRSLLERAASMGLSSMATSMAGSIRSYASSTGTTSRPGSVKSFGSQGASEVVHVDTDDCGGSIVDSDGHFSGGGQEETPHKVDPYKSEVNLPLDTLDGTDNVKNNDDDIGCDGGSFVQSTDVNLATFHDRLSVDHGRISPGGTVYKGRGVRRYQGRFMHLPLQRFRQNLNIALPIEGTVIGHGTKAATPDYFADNQGNSSDGEIPWRRGGSRSKSRSRSRDRSRSRERTRGSTRASSNRNWSRSRSPCTRRQRSPPRYHHEDRGSRGGSRNQYRNGNDHSRWRNNDHSPQNGSNYRRNRSFSSKYRGMTPRDPRHRGHNPK